MMKNPCHIVFTHAARETGIPVDELQKAAVAAAGCPKAADTWFKAFRVKGRQFALSTRMIVEVDYFPHRTPVDVLPAPTLIQRSR